MAKSWWRAALACASLLALLPASGFSQTQATTGVISGTVVDQTDAALPGASVAIRNTATNFEKIETTGTDGRFRAVLLPLGPYRITVTLPGFTTLVREGVTLSVGQEVNLRLPLQVSGVQQEVRVTGEAPVVETSRTVGSTLINQEAVQNLPNASHNFLDFIKLTPGVAIVQGPDGDELSINGQKGIHNNVSVDGQDFNNPFFGEQRGGQRPPFTFNLDAVQEVVIVADGAPAEFGRSSGGFVNVITKSGTNDFHGSAHVYYKDDSLSAKAAKRGGGRADKFDLTRWQDGFTLGGRLLPDRLFYFIGADAQQGDSTKQTDPTRIEQRLVDYFDSIGIPDENGPIVRTDDAFVGLVKLDWRATEQHLATLRYAYSWSQQENGTFDVDSWGVSSNATEKVWSYSIGGSVISTLTSSLLNELRGQYAREDRPRPYPGPIVTSTGRPLPDTAFDFVHGYRFGMPYFIPVQYYDTRTQLLDNFSIVKGDHSIKVGAEWSRVVSKQTFIGFANGIWKFSSTDGFLNYARNPNYVECSNGSSSATGACPAGTTVTGPVIFYLQQAGVGGRTVEDAGTQSIAQEELAAFVQDSWQPLRNLTINVGLRWEGIYQPDPRTPPDQVFFAPFIGTTRDGQEFPSDGTIPDDTKMWQPRLGISWDPGDDGKTVARATWGIFYGRVPALNIASSRSTNGSIGQGVYRDSTFRNFGGPLPPAYPNLIPASQIGNPDHPDVYVFDRDFRSPKTTSWSIGVDREIVPGLAGVLKYNYAKGENVTRFLNQNDALLGNDPTVRAWGSGLGPDGTNGIGTLWTVTSNARSKYWGVTLGLNKNLSNRYAFQAYYTYSKDKSDDDNERDPFTLRYARITDLDAEYSFSDRDQRHRFNTWFLWQAPWDINVNARYSYRSAQPQSLKPDGTPSANPWMVAGPSDRIRSDGTIVRRNTGRKDNKYSSLDLRISKEFRLSVFTIEPILEAFNLLNSDNFLSPEVTNLVFNFDGTIRSGNGDPRQVQFGLRVAW
ncbi:MAG TPA: carboxypeptidase regulatory-like domain-containing protein [Thermoanaerobaculia bacterium]|nr:carboxypeptidase regulatory-like domain-containing protein [Thermoanaerobaculia bacterium]